MEPSFYTPTQFFFVLWEYNEDTLPVIFFCGIFLTWSGWLRWMLPFLLIRKSLQIGHISITFNAITRYRGSKKKCRNIVCQINRFDWRLSLEIGDVFTVSLAVWITRKYVSIGELSLWKNLPFRYLYLTPLIWRPLRFSIWDTNQSSSNSMSLITKMFFHCLRTTITKFEVRIKIENILYLHLSFSSLSIIYLLSLKDELLNWAK